MKFLKLLDTHNRHSGSEVWMETLKKSCQICRIAVIVKGLR